MARLSGGFGADVPTHFSVKAEVAATAAEVLRRAGRALVKAGLRTLRKANEVDPPGSWHRHEQAARRIHKNSSREV